MKPLAANLNAYTLSFPEELLSEIRDSYYQELSGFLLNPAHQHFFEGGKTHRKSTGKGYYLFSYDTYPLLWLSNQTPETHQIFAEFYQQLNLEKHFCDLIDFEKRLVMYCGFFVLGNQAPETLWHYDYLQGANAYTLITPLFDLAPGHGQLLYQDAQNREHTYTYQLGEAIIFGDNFLHSTEPYAHNKQYRVLASFTFGTDKPAYWPLIKQAVAAQSKYYCLPCGHMSNNCQCNYSKPHGLLAKLSHFFKAVSS